MEIKIKLSAATISMMNTLQQLMSEVCGKSLNSWEFSTPSNNCVRSSCEFNSDNHEVQTWLDQYNQEDRTLGYICYRHKETDRWVSLDIATKPCGFADKCEIIRGIVLGNDIIISPQGDPAILN